MKDATRNVHTLTGYKSHPSAYQLIRQAASDEDLFYEIKLYLTGGDGDAGSREFNHFQVAQIIQSYAQTYSLDGRELEDMNLFEIWALTKTVLKDLGYVFKHGRLVDDTFIGHGDQHGK